MTSIPLRPKRASAKKHLETITGAVVCSECPLPLGYHGRLADGRPCLYTRMVVPAPPGIPAAGDTASAWVDVSTPKDDRPRWSMEFVTVIENERAEGTTTAQCEHHGRQVIDHSTIVAAVYARSDMKARTASD